MLRKSWEAALVLNFMGRRPSSLCLPHFICVYNGRNLPMFHGIVKKDLARRTKGFLLSKMPDGTFKGKMAHT